MSKKFGKYTLLKKIAVGGMASIYLAEYPTIEGFKKELVVKKILPKYSSNQFFTSMFVEEAKIAVNLNHRNIIQTFDFGKVDNEYYIAMEYIDGFDLFQIFKFYHFNKKEINDKIILFILMEILKGLNYIHEKKNNNIDNLIHRDLSLNNIIISKTGEIKILDFGIVKSSKEEKDSFAKGKRSYMAPEQFSEDSFDNRIDIYSLGIIAWRLLTGDKPFDLSEIKTSKELANVQIPNITEINPKISPELSLIIMKALEKDKEKRYYSATEFYDVLYQYSMKNDKIISYFEFKYFVEDNGLFFKSEQSYEVTKVSNKNSRKAYDKNAFKEAILSKKRNIILIYCDFKTIFSPYDDYSILEIKEIMKDFFNLISNIAYKEQLSIISLEQDGMIFVTGAISAKKNDILNSIKFSLNIKNVFDLFIKDYNILIQLSIMINRGEVVIEEIKDMKIKISYMDNLLKNTRRKAEDFPEGVYLNFSIDNIINNFESETYRTLVKINKLNKNSESIKESEILIGRKKEFNFLKTRLDTAIKTSTMSLNYLIGEAGIGKTMLSEELLSYLKQNHNNFYFIRGRALSSDSPYDLYRDIIKNFLKIKNKTDFEKKMNSYLFSLEKNRRREMIILLGHFLNFDYSKENYIIDLKDSKNSLIDMQLTNIKSFFKIITEKKYVVLFLENIHLLSTSDLLFSEEIISELDKSIFILAMARNSLLTKKEINKRVSIVNLKKLDYEKSIYFIEQVLNNKLKTTNTQSEDFTYLDSLGPIIIKNISTRKFIIPKDLLEFIYLKSSGNPFFIKEIIKFLITRKVIYLDTQYNLIFKKDKLDILNIPFSLNTLLQSEFDELTPNEKIVLQRASIFGDKFWISPLIKILGDKVTKVVDLLEKKGFLYKRSISNSLLKTEYIFKHSLLKDIIYNSIMEKTKKDFHILLADIFISYKDNVLNGLIANQFKSAREYDKAAIYYLLSAENSFKSFFLNESLLFYNEYLNLFDFLEKKDLKKYLSIKIKVANLNKELGNYNNTKKILLDVIEEIKDLKKVSYYKLKYHLNYSLADFYFLIKDYSNSLQYLEFTKQFSSTKEDYFKILSLETWIFYKQNILEKANKNLEKIIKNSSFYVDISEIYSLYSIILFDLGNVKKALEYENKVLEDGVNTNNYKKIFLSLNNIGEIYRKTHDLDKAKIYYNRAMKLTKDRHIIDYFKILLLNNLAKLSIDNNKKNDSIKLLKKSITLLKNIDIKSLHYDTHIILIELYLTMEEKDEVLKEIEIIKKYISDENKILIAIYEIMGSYNKQNAIKKDSELKQLLLKTISSNLSYKNKNYIYKKITDFYKKVNPSQKQNIKSDDFSILYVEDEKGIRENLTPFLKRFTKKLSVAKNGEEGLELYKIYKPTLVISDIKMPKMNGIEMVSFMRAKNSKQHIIFLTAHNDDKLITDAINMQVDGYILKPINLKLLKEKINLIKLG